LGCNALRDFCTAGSAALKAPIDYLGTAVLGACSAAIGNSYRLHILSEFTTSAVLWTALVGEPSTAKSPAWRLSVVPLKRRHRKAYQQFEKERQAYQADLSYWESRSKKERGVRPELPTFKQIYVDDFTIESLATVIQGNPRGTAVLNDELAGWLKSFDQYRKGQGGDRERWLKMYDFGDLQINRKIDGPLLLHDVAVPELGTSQPDKLAPLLRQQNDGLKERLLIAYPEDQTPKALDEAQIDPEVKAGYRALIDALLDLEPAAPVDDPDDDAHLLRLGHVDRQLAAEFDPALRALYGKARGYAARLILVLHLARTVLSGSIPQEVPQITVTDAWNLSTYFLAHAAALLHEHHAQACDLVDRVVAWVRGRGGCATLRDVVTNMNAVRTASQAREIARQIEDRGEGRLVSTEVKPGTVKELIVLAGYCASTTSSTSSTGAAS
jgi:hypothetical protein